MSALEAQIARLTDRLAALETPPAAAVPTPAAPRPAAPEGMTVHTAIAGSGYVMPTEAQLRALHDMVVTTYPVLKDTAGRLDGPDEPFRRFAAAFRALGAIGRAPALNRDRAANWWVDHAQERLAGLGAVSDLNLASFTAAVVAHGDIPFRALDRFPYELEFGLVAHGGGRPAGDAWRRLLAGDRLPAPAEGLMRHDDLRAHARFA
ncbi:hypothetical protein MKK75_05705 [Methylobacterium sp. J-030]|uniref:hypothetical protein n=1 Tax=Methylobacterium sp. J-030 TaxID=2836627 RepID=UPI001FBAEBB1|nr:hypothetical protein [Methylobacterium sp. J-030]MCJ2068307.1 hypothetical protein [Methylobacterium sp. J-030]